MSERLRVIVAEDNYLVREGARRLLEESGEVTVVATVGSAPELLDAVRRLDPDVVLTDIRMPPGNHMDGIHAAHASAPSTRTSAWSCCHSTPTRPTPSSS